MAKEKKKKEVEKIRREEVKRDEIKRNEIKREEIVEEVPKLPADKRKILDDLKKFTKAVLDKHGKYIKAIVMMGSVAREEFKPTSDVDVFAIVDDTAVKLTNE